MVRPRKIPKNYVPPPWVSENEEEEDIQCYLDLKRSRPNLQGPVREPHGVLAKPTEHVESQVDQEGPALDSESDESLAGEQCPEEQDDQVEPNAGDLEEPDMDSESDESLAGEEWPHLFDELQEPDAEDAPDPGHLYKDLLHTLSKEWLIVELQHEVSKAASDAYWDCLLYTSDAADE